MNSDTRKSLESAIENGDFENINLIVSEHTKNFSDKIAYLYLLSNDRFIFVPAGNIDQKDRETVAINLEKWRMGGGVLVLNTPCLVIDLR